MSRFILRTSIFLGMIFYSLCPLLTQNTFPNLQFAYYGLEEGLSQTSVKYMLQDKHGFLWLGTQDGLDRFDGYEFVVFRNDPDDPYSLSDNNIRLLYEDRSGRLWVGGESGSLQYLDRQSGRFIHFPDDPGLAQKIQNKKVKRVFEDHRGMLWMVGDSLFAGLTPQTGELLDFSSKSTDWISHFIFEDSSYNLWVLNKEGLQKLNAERNSWASFPDVRHTSIQGWIAFAYEDRHRQIWISADFNQLYYLPPNAQQFIHFPVYQADQKSLLNDHFIAMAEDRQGVLWGATSSNGLCRLDRVSQKFIFYKNQSADPKSLVRNAIRSLLKDKTDNFWVGSWAGGLQRLLKAQKRFTHIRSDPDNRNSLSQEQVESFYEDPSGNLWISTTDGGLNQLNQNSGIWTHYRKNDKTTFGLRSDQIPTLYGDSKGALWLSAYNQGLQKMDAQSGRLAHFRHDPLDPNSLSNNLCHGLWEDKKGRFWVGAFDGVLNQFAPETETFIRRKIGRDNQFQNIGIIREDRSGRLWIGSRENGLAVYNPDTEAFRVYHNDPNQPKSLSMDAVFFLHWDQKERLWIGTSGGGLNLLLDEEKGEFKNYHMRDGLPNDVVYAILEDGQGRLWMSTNRGISCFDPETEIFRNFSLSDGLQSYEFNQRAAYKSPYTGKMYFGGVNGYNVFHPDSIQWDTAQAPVVFTAVTRYDPEGALEEPTINYFVEDQPALTLASDEKILHFRFAALAYRDNEKIQYQYQLEGFSERWQNIGDRRELTFTNLNPGRYVLRVKSTNSDGLWNAESTSLAFTVLPPWYQTDWAYLLFAALLGLLFYVINRFYRARRRLRSELVERRQAAERLEEMAAFKTNFFTNITHEFRTPLTVMMGLIQQIKGYSKEKELIARNGRQLLGLINQVLDLNQIEAQKMDVRWRQGDVMQFIRFSAEAFSLLAKKKKQRLEVSCAPQVLTMDYDPDKLQKIVNNLLSNALKFTPEGGQIRLDAYQQEAEAQSWLCLDVSDSGPGVPTPYQEMIFQPYGQALHSEGGTGLGLALVKELTALLGGTIELDPRSDKGSAFRLRFPIHNDAPLSASSEESEVKKTSASVLISNGSPLRFVSGRPTLLVMEDNEDVQYYYRNLLQSHYNIFCAKDGKEGLEKVQKIRPDMVISDVMTPVMDGYEFCRRLKNDPATQALSVILVTAKASREDKLKGFESQADAYLIKPFDQEELLLRIRQLLQKKETLKAQSGSILAKNGLASKAENGAVLFMEKFHKILNDNLQNKDFKIKTLCREMNMNHVSLNKRIKTYTNYTTAQYIRYYRLNLAKELLRNTDLSIAEVSYEIGVPEPSNFNHLFKKTFGKTPKQWRDASKF